MTQFAVIKKLTAPDRAEVEVLRGTACGDSCESCGVCHYASKIRVEAANDIGAELGDRGGDRGHHLPHTGRGGARLRGALRAVLRRIRPRGGLSLGEGLSMVISFAFFAVGMGVAVAVGRRHRKNPITYNIISVIGHEAA